jgi:hypothetical protein
MAVFNLTRGVSLVVPASVEQYCIEGRATIYSRGLWNKSRKRHKALQISLISRICPILDVMLISFPLTVMAMLQGHAR